MRSITETQMEEMYRNESDAGTPLPAKLYLCATPIGNMGDITQRVTDVLKNVYAVYCEDTRNTGAMLKRLGIKARLEACHEHNEEASAERIAALVGQGLAVAYVSDAGMPCISDPGERLVRAFIDRGLPFEVLPGASASLTAAILSGLSTKRIYFAGFLPRENRERVELLAEIKRVGATVVIYESPHRVGKTLEELNRALGDRDAAVVREMTKRFEQTVRGRLSELADRFSDEEPKGECVIVLSGKKSGDAAAESPRELLSRLLASGMSVKDAARQAALLLDVPKSEAYALAMKLKNEG